MLVQRAFRSSVKTCLNKTGATKAQVELFNKEQDLTDLPNNYELKCYMYCQLHEMDWMDEKGADIRYDVVLKQLRLLRPESQDIYLNMGKKCFSRRYQTPDPCEVAYLWNACMKKGDIKVSARHIGVQ